MSTSINQHDTLDSFDIALLGELRQEVQVRSLRGRTRRRRALAVAGAVAATTAAFGISSIGSPAAAAFDVDRTDTGDIRVTIHRLEDADKLEQDLAAQGITAEVDYDRAPFTFSQVDGDVVFGSAEVDPHPAAPDSPCANGDNSVVDAGLSTDGRDLVIAIPQSSPLHDPESALHLSTTGDLTESVAGIVVRYVADGTNCTLGALAAR